MPWPWAVVPADDVDAAAPEQAAGRIFEVVAFQSLLVGV